MTPRGSRVTAATASLVMSAGAALPLAARIQGGRPPTPWPQLAAFCPAATMTATGALVLAVAARSRRTAVVAAAVLLPLVLSGVLPVPGRVAPPVDHRESDGLPATGTFTVMTVNAFLGQADADDIVAVAREHGVDLLAVQELTPALQARLETAGLGSLLPHRHDEPLPGASGAGLWSRYPLDPVPAVEGMGFVAPRALVRLPSGPAVTVTCAHPLAPRPGADRRWADDLERLREELAAATGPQLVAGDLNAGRDHAAFRALLDTGLVDAAEAGHRFGPHTWPSRLALVHLDHVLVSPGALAPVSAATLRIAGTDHRAVVTRLGYREP